jgi:replicative DNA helicase
MKEIPRDKEIEVKVLSSLMNDRDAIFTITDILQPSSFYDNTNRLIYTTAVDLYNQSKTPDLILISTELKGKIKPAVLAEICTQFTPDDVLGDYCRVLKELEMRRDLIYLQKLTDRAYNNTDDIFNLTSDISKYLDKIGTTNKQNTKLGVNILGDCFNSIEEASKNTNYITGISSGFTELDRLNNGWNPGELIIIAARPGMGKTTLALNMMLNAIKQDKRVLMFSLEMTTLELGFKLISTITGLDNDRVKRGKLTNSEWKDIHKETAFVINSDKLLVDDDGNTDLFGLKSISKRFNHKSKIDMIIVDYLQLLNGSDSSNKQQNREQQISYLSRSLKALAKELNIPIICLSQLSRAVESRGNKRPMLSDLRESGAIEQDANQVLFIFRDGYYNKIDTSGDTEIILAKNRAGQTGTINLSFDGAKSIFTDFKPNEYKPF